MLILATSVVVATSKVRLAREDVIAVEKLLIVNVIATT